MKGMKVQIHEGEVIGLRRCIKVKKQVLLIVALIWIVMLICVSITSADDLSIENKIVSPEDKTIWVANSGKSPDQASITLTVTNLANPAARAPLDVILALDSSGSLQYQDSARFIVAAAREFIDNLDPNSDRVGIVYWNDTIVGTLPLTSNLNEAKAYLELYDVQGGTCIYNALNASQILLRNARPSSTKAIILFSDGYDTCSKSMDFRGLAAQIRDSGIQIYTIGLGTSDIADLAAIGNTYHHANDDELIPLAFKDAENEIFGSLSNVKVRYTIPNGIDIVSPSVSQMNYIIQYDLNATPSSLPEPADIFSVNGGKLLVWNIGFMRPYETRSFTFNIDSMVSGTYQLGVPPTSAVTYNTLKGTKGIQNISVAEIIVKDTDSFVSIYYILIILVGTVAGFIISKKLIDMRK